MSDKKIVSLDGLRTVSILLVVLSHVSDALPQWASKYLGIPHFGWVGVTIFFVISGFLITTLLLAEKFSNYGKINIQRFYIRRFLRILPVSFLYICLILLLNKRFNLKIECSAFWHAFTYTMNFVAGPWLLAHLWSLAVEEQFYLFWPWVTKFSLKTITRLALIIIAYAPFVRAITYLLPDLKFITLAPFFEHADSLMIGCLLAISRYAWPDIWNSSLLKNRLLCLSSIFIIWLITLLGTIRHHGFGYFTVPLGITIISLCAAYIIASGITFKNNAGFRFLNHPLIVYIGVLSYSIYIWQQFFLVPKDFQNMLPWWRIFPINILLTFSASILSYHLWEKGFLKLKEKFKAVSNT